MGECLISRRGGEAYKLPVLDASYPQNVNVAMSSGGTVSFNVSITEHGKPSEYTYQWYKNNQAVSGANSMQYIVASTSAGTFTVYCEVTNKAGTVTSRVATATIYDAVPTSDCWSGGQAKLVKENNYDWHIVCLSSLTLTMSRDTNVDVFICGGGGSGGDGSDHGGGGGGGGGKTTTKKGVNLTAGKSYSVVVGSGGGNSSAFSYSASAGSNGSSSTDNVNGGSGGSGGGAGGRGGGEGSGGKAGTQGVLPFGTSYGSSYHSWYYGGGGGGGSGSGGGPGAGGLTGGGTGGKKVNGGSYTSAVSGTANTGGGGGGGGHSWNSGVAGGSGIVIIRNAR